jgi:hypothetical protein
MRRPCLHAPAHTCGTRRTSHDLLVRGARAQLRVICPPLLPLQLLRQAANLPLKLRHAGLRKCATGAGMWWDGGCRLMGKESASEDVQSWWWPPPGLPPTHTRTHARRNHRCIVVMMPLHIHGALQGATSCPHHAVLHSKRQPLGHACLAQHGSQFVPRDVMTPSQAPRHGVLKVRTRTRGI